MLKPVLPTLEPTPLRFSRSPRGLALVTHTVLRTGRSDRYKPHCTDPNLRSGMAKDTHFYHTTVVYKDHQLPIKMPLATFPEEVGEYSLITLIRVFSSQALVSGPQHPHLHTNVPQTHPTIILFNALVTGKHIINIRRVPEACGQGVELRAVSLRAGVCRAPRLHRARVLIRQPE
ncbi:hypothetical protein B0H14DRAFT_2440359 [Mycena olivaceomarginata]|nr:hypothetical protein B0H14DRAFT_2440359 [Mycena olivaceomarginata]